MGKRGPKPKQTRKVRGAPKNVLSGYTLFCRDYRKKLKNSENENNDSALNMVYSEYIKIDYSTNHNYQPNSLELFLKVQDSIYKKNCADVLYIKRKEKTYEFLIGDHWYNSKERSAEFIKYWHERRSIILKSDYCE